MMMVPPHALGAELHLGLDIRVVNHGYRLKPIDEHAGRTLAQLQAAGRVDLRIQQIANLTKNVFMMMKRGKKNKEVNEGEMAMVMEQKQGGAGTKKKKEREKEKERKREREKERKREREMNILVHCRFPTW
jgi:hypothetical protein